MKYLNITGHSGDFDRVMEKYISKHEIGLEVATKELAGLGGISPFNVVNPYSDLLASAEKIIREVNLETDVYVEVSKEKAQHIIETVSTHYEDRGNKIRQLENKREAIIKYMDKIEPFLGLDFNVEKLEHFEFITYHFGKMPTDSFKQFETFLYNETNILFVTSKNDGKSVWGVYFVPISSKNKVASIFSSLYFQKIWIDYNFDGEMLSGSFRKIYFEFKSKLARIEAEILEFNKQKLDSSEITQSELVSAYKKIKQLHSNYDARKYAAHTVKDFYILVGWATEKEALALKQEMEDDKKVVLIIESKNDAIKSKPPTKLKNVFFAKPFEFFVSMYGLPSYGEIDPTFLVALTYTLLFGIMFGDVGQGAILTVAGLYLSKKKGMGLGSILAIIGCSSVFFGFMYGSIFGFEDKIIPTLLISPAHSINEMLITTVVIGVVLIFLCMGINIVNLARRKDWLTMALSANGICGILFYASAVSFALLTFKGYNVGFLKIVIAVTVALIGLRHPIEAYFHNKDSKGEHKKPASPVMYVVELVIELFEVMLSYFTNTISFVRVGAFALSHAGMMSAVMLLAQKPNGSFNWIVVILGNLLVICLEGLVVGIQVLRLEFYEIFSRFFGGEGRK